MGKRCLLTLLGGIVLAAVLLPAAPAMAAREAAIAKVVIVSRLSFIAVENLEFGSILPSAASGTVTVSPANVRSKTGGVTLVGGTVQPSRFAGNGTVNQIVLISLGSATTTITRVGGTETMIVDTLTIGSTPTAVLTATPRSFRISSPTGIFNFPIGARLNVTANQVPGDYSGTFTVTLNYQ